MTNNGDLWCACLGTLEVYNFWSTNAFINLISALKSQEWAYESQHIQISSIINLLRLNMAEREQNILQVI